MNKYKKIFAFFLCFTMMLMFMTGCKKRMKQYHTEMQIER